MPSYRRKMGLEVFALYDANSTVQMTVREEDGEKAWIQFHEMLVRHPWIDIGPEPHRVRSLEASNG